jgi:hypothetical protein
MQPMRQLNIPPKRRRVHVFSFGKRGLVRMIFFKILVFPSCSHLFPMKFLKFPIAS